MPHHKDREEALAYLKRRQDKVAAGELLPPDRARIRDLQNLLLEDYDVRGVSQSFIAGLKVKAILILKLGDIKASKFTTVQMKQYIIDRLKKVKPGTVSSELGMLHRAFQLGYGMDGSFTYD